MNTEYNAIVGRFLGFMPTFTMMQAAGAFSVPPESTFEMKLKLAAVRLLSLADDEIDIYFTLGNTDTCF